MSTPLISIRRPAAHIPGPLHACVAALNALPQALCLFDADRQLLFANARLSVLFGMPATALQPGLTFAAALARARRASNLAAADIDIAATSIAALVGKYRPASHQHNLADGRALIVNFEPADEGGWLLTFEDITARRQAWLPTHNG